MKVCAINGGAGKKRHTAIVFDTPVGAAAR